MATTKIFSDSLKEEKIVLPKAFQRGYSMSYSTNVPRQLGLAGSSAICTAAFRALMDWHGVSEKQIPPERLAGYVLRAEQQELGIAAGLQDRVAQAYDQPVFMDFTPEAFAMHDGKFGSYEVLDAAVIEFFKGRLFLLFPVTPPHVEEEGKSSGKVHSPVRKLWEQGDPVVRQTMVEIGGLAVLGKKAVEEKDANTFVDLMNRNFALRLKLFGAAVAERDRKVIDVAKSFGPGIGAKLPGSGGAVLAFAVQGKDFAEFMAKQKDVTAVELELRHPSRL